jgi:hypothetical protein
MLCKVAYQTPAGWFIYEDTLFANEQRALTFIKKQKTVNKENFFLVYPSNYGWTR